MNIANYRTSIILAIVFTLLLSTFWFFQDLAFIIFLSLLLQLLLRPIVDFLAHRIPRALAAALMVAAFVALLTGILVILSLSFVPTFKEFVAELPHISLSLQNLPFFTDAGFFQTELSNLLARLRSLSAEFLRASLSFLLAAVGKFMDFVIIIFVSFYLLKDGEGIKIWLAELFPAPSRTRVLRLFDNLLRALRAYICSQLAMCAVTGIVVFCYFTLMGLPYASVFALLSAAGEMIPVLGPTVASVFGVLMTAATVRDLALPTLLFYAALTQINHNVIYPALVGKSLHLHPIAIILGVVFGGELLGPAGMFLAVPFIVIVKIVITDIHRAREEMQRSGDENGI